ncbi:MAG: hypothetical protein AAFS10_11155, partial [Myxococcota bacterium]
EAEAQRLRAERDDPHHRYQAQWSFEPVKLGWFRQSYGTLRLIPMPLARSDRLLVLLGEQVADIGADRFDALDATAAPVRAIVAQLTLALMASLSVPRKLTTLARLTRSPNALRFEREGKPPLSSVRALRLALFDDLDAELRWGADDLPRLTALIEGIKAEPAAYRTPEGVLVLWSVLYALRRVAFWRGVWSWFGWALAWGALARKRRRIGGLQRELERSLIGKDGEHVMGMALDWGVLRQEAKRLAKSKERWSGILGAWRLSRDERP